VPFILEHPVHALQNTSRVSIVTGSSVLRTVRGIRRASPASTIFYLTRRQEILAFSPLFGITVTPWAMFVPISACLLFVVSEVKCVEKNVLIFGVFCVQIMPQLKNFFQKSKRAHHLRTRRHLCVNFDVLRSSQSRDIASRRKKQSNNHPPRGSEDIQLISSSVNLGVPHREKYFKHVLLLYLGKIKKKTFNIKYMRFSHPHSTGHPSWSHRRSE